MEFVFNAFFVFALGCMVYMFLALLFTSVRESRKETGRKSRSGTETLEAPGKGATM